MNKAAISAEWNYFRMVLGVTRKLVDQIPEDKLDFRPTPEVRSAKELAAHVYNFLTEAVDTVEAGKHIESKERDFATKAELLSWMDAQVSKAFAKFDKLTDPQLAARIETWGQTFHGWQILDFTYQEAMHHRGQLTVYLRLMGIQPVFIYDMA
jgi:uncharacterized damage-inducible protein DinB